MSQENLHQRRGERDFPGGSVVGTLLSNARGVGSIPDWGAKIPTCLEAKQSKHKTEAIL